MIKNISLDPQGRARKRIAIFKRKVSRCLDKLGAENSQTNIIKALLGERGRSSLLLLSDMEARMEASNRLSSLLLAQRETHPERRYYFITFADKDGLISDRTPVIDLTGMLRKARRALRSLDLNAIAVAEVHPLMNYPGGGAGRSLMWGVHAIAWTDGDFDPTEASLALLTGGAWKSALGAPPVQIKKVEETPEDLEEVARYIVKPPHSAKNRMPRKKNPSEFRLMDTVKGYRPEFALRVLEVLSQIEMLDVVFGIGDGTKLRQTFRKDMTEWHRKRAAGEKLLAGDFDIWHFWLRFRRETGSKLYLPVRMVSGGYRMRPVKQAVPKLRRRKRSPLSSRKSIAKRPRLRRKK